MNLKNGYLLCRKQYNRRIVKAVKKKLKEANTQKNMGQIQKYGNMLIRQDPYNEELYYEIMEIYAAGGNYIWPSSFIMIWRRLYRRIWE